MTPNPAFFESLLIAAALGQLAVAALNLRLEAILGWKPHLETLPPLMREVFVVHKWFISITLVIFATLTLRFAGEIASGASSLGRWLAAAIGIFWAIRTVIQWCYYGRDNWRGKGRETAVHWILTLVYGGWTALYLFCAFR